MKLYEATFKSEAKKAVAISEKKEYRNPVEKRTDYYITLFLADAEITYHFNGKTNEIIGRHRKDK